jgi:hypothetical protein
MRTEYTRTRIIKTAMMRYAIAIALFLTVAAPAAQAELVVIIGNTPDVIIGNTPEDNPGWAEAGLEYGTGLHDNNGKTIGMSIPEGRNYRLHSFRAYLTVREGNTVLEMLDDFNGHPGDSLTVFDSPVFVENIDQWYTFTPSEPVILYGGQTYWFMLSNDFPATGTKNWSLVSYWRGRSVQDPVTISDGFVSWAGAYYEGADGMFYSRDFPNAFQVIAELIADEIDPQELVDSSCEPEEAWKNHGEYIRCVSHRVEELIEDGMITEEDGDAIVATAAQSDVGKKNGSGKRSRKSK